MQRRHLLLLAAALAPSALVAAPASAGSARRVVRRGNGLLLRNVRGGAGPSTTGTLTGRFRGDVLIQSLAFNSANNTLSVTGLINGVARGTAGRGQRITNQTFTATATLAARGSGGAAGNPTLGAQAKAVCGILSLDIGRITLNLLGLVIDLAPIDLDITGRTGPGNLLGNLLCGLVGLLNPLGALAQILALIQQINSLLAGNRVVG